MARCATCPHGQIKAVAEDIAHDELKVKTVSHLSDTRMDNKDRPRMRSALLNAYQELMEAQNHRGAAGSRRLARGTGEGHHC